MKNRGVRHLVECHCVLPQYRDSKNPVYHKFVVFSVIDESDTVIPKFVECNNCGVVHKVHDILKSEIVVGKETVRSSASIDDIKLMISTDIANVLSSYSVDISTWEHALFIQQNEVWGSSIVLIQEHIEDEVQGKALIFEGKQNIKIEPFTRKLTIDHD